MTRTADTLRAPSKKLRRTSWHSAAAVVAGLAFGAAIVMASTAACSPRARATHDPVKAPFETPLEEGVDAAILPGDDFFAFANGEWLAATTIPEGKDRWSARTEIAERTGLQVSRLIDDASLRPWSATARKIADFRAALADDVAIEARGLAPIRGELDRIRAVRDREDLAHLLGQGLRADVDPLNWGVFDSAHLLGLSVEACLHGEPTYVAFLLQGGLGLGDRENYSSAAPDRAALRGLYREYVEGVLRLVDPDPSGAAERGLARHNVAERADAVLALENAIALSHASREESAREANAANQWNRADFPRRAPGMSWPAFFAAAGLAAQDSFVVWQPSAIEGAAALVGSEPLDAWRDYLTVRAVDRHADVLPRALSEPALTLRAAIAGGSASAPESRAERALAATRVALADEIGELYVERHFPPERKAKVEAIADDVLAAFVRRVEIADWMAPGTRAEALEKLAGLHFELGYPEQKQDEPKLVVDRADAYGNLDRVAKHAYRRAVARLGRPVDRDDWWLAPQTAGAVLLFQQNAYNFPAALLQSPKFDAAAPDASSYGAIGAIVGHEMSHFVDTLGAEYDADGRQRRWWTDEDRARFDRLTAPLAAQFSAYKPFPDRSVDGQLTLSENVADLAGLAAAFEAHRHALDGRASDPLFVRRQDRLFFLGFARAWRSEIRDEAMRKQLESDGHAPESFRVATVRNFAPWYEAFDVRPGQRLYLEPRDRVRVW